MNESSARPFCEISETKPQAQVELSEQNFLVKNKLSNLKMNLIHFEMM